MISPHAHQLGCAPGERAPRWANKSRRLGRTMQAGATHRHDQGKQCNGGDDGACQRDAGARLGGARQRQAVVVAGAGEGEGEGECNPIPEQRLGVQAAGRGVGCDGSRSTMWKAGPALLGYYWARQDAQWGHQGQHAACCGVAGALGSRACSQVGVAGVNEEHQQRGAQSQQARPAGNSGAAGRSGGGGREAAPLQKDRWGGVSALLC